MKRDYPRLTWQQFSDQLISTRDLDPVYVILYKAKLPEDVLGRWLLAYWCYYHAGVASKLAESKDFYVEGEPLYSEARTWPRGFERRHFRGHAAHMAWNWLCYQNKPEERVQSLYALDAQSVMDKIQVWPMFGPWIAWKAADMLERVVGIPVDFSGTSLRIYSEPKKGAALIRFGDWNHPIKTAELDDTVNMMLERYKNTYAPPNLNRTINIQEIETCLCKYKAHAKGFYYCGKDTHELSEALNGWGDLAQELSKHLPIGWDFSE